MPAQLVFPCLFQTVIQLIKIGSLLKTVIVRHVIDIFIVYFCTIIITNKVILFSWRQRNTSHLQMAISNNIKQHVSPFLIITSLWRSNDITNYFSVFVEIHGINYSINSEWFNIVEYKGLNYFNLHAILGV